MVLFPPFHFLEDSQSSPKNADHSPRASTPDKDFPESWGRSPTPRAPELLCPPLVHGWALQARLAPGRCARGRQTGYSLSTAQAARRSSAGGQHSGCWGLSEQHRPGAAGRGQHEGKGRCVAGGSADRKASPWGRCWKTRLFQQGLAGHLRAEESMDRLLGGHCPALPGGEKRQRVLLCLLIKAPAQNPPCTPAARGVAPWAPPAVSRVPGAKEPWAGALGCWEVGVSGQTCSGCSCSVLVPQTSKSAGPAPVSHVSANPMDQLVSLSNTCSPSRAPRHSGPEWTRCPPQVYSLPLSVPPEQTRRSLLWTLGPG